MIALLGAFLTVRPTRRRCGQDLPLDQLHIASVPAGVYAPSLILRCNRDLPLCWASLVPDGRLVLVLILLLADIPTVFDNYSTPRYRYLFAVGEHLLTFSYDRIGANVMVDGRVINLGPAPPSEPPEPYPLHCLILNSNFLLTAAKQDFGISAAARITIASDLWCVSASPCVILSPTTELPPDGCVYRVLQRRQSNVVQQLDHEMAARGESPLSRYVLQTRHLTPCERRMCARPCACVRRDRV